MFTTTYTDIYSGKNVSPAFPQYAAISLTQANLQLAWPTQFQNTNIVVAVIMDITPTAGAFSIKMPDAREVGTGFAFTINNPGNFSFDLLDNEGNIIVTIPNASARIIWLISNATQAGLWRNLPGSAGGGAVTSVDAISRKGVAAEPNLVITGTPALPITGAGTIKFELGADLSALTSFAAGTGFSVRTAANTWALRTITGTAGQILVTNGNGIVDNPVISLVPDITGITSIRVGNLTLSANSIVSENANGDIIFNPDGTGAATIASTKKIKFMAENNVNYIAFRGGVSVIDQDYIWPTAAPLASQVLGFSGGSSLSWFSIPSSSGPTTINAVARYSNTVGGIKDSLSSLSDLGELTLTSFSNNNIKIGGIGGQLPQTISTLSTDLNLIVAPNGNGVLDCKADLWISPSAATQRKLALWTTNNFYAGLASNNAMANNYTWTLPIAGGVAGYFVTDSFNVMSIRQFPVTVVDNIPKFSDTSGSLTASSLTNTGGIVTSTDDMALLLAATQLKFRFYNQTGNFYTALQAGNATANRTFTLPTAFPPTPGILKSSSAGVMSIDPLVAAAGPLRADAAGVITVNNFGTIANHIAKYSDGAATLQDSGCFIDVNNNLSLGTNVIGTSATKTLTLNTGTAATAAVGGILSIGARDTASGTVLALYGGGDSGITASITNTITNKISIFVGGTRYYLLATTSAA